MAYERLKKSLERVRYTLLSLSIGWPISHFLKSRCVGGSLTRLMPEILGLRPKEAPLNDIRREMIYIKGAKQAYRLVWDIAISYRKRRNADAQPLGRRVVIFAYI